MRMLIKNAKLIGDKYDCKQLYDVYIEDGVIEKIEENLEVEGAMVTDAEGNLLLSGLIDMHCNICDPGFEYMEDIETASNSAVRGGFTSITCEPDTKPVIDNKTVVEYIVSKSKEYALLNIYPYGSMSIGCEGKELAEIGEMHQAGIVGISDGDRSIENASFLRNVLRYSKMFDMPVITHCEDKSLSGKGVMNEGNVSSGLGLWGIPKEAEEVIVARNIILAEATGSRLHIAHVSTKRSVQLIREAKQRGAKITCETCPHYFMLTAQAVGNYNTFAKVNPPLRNDDDVEAIKEGLADGTIDVIASGHSPSKLTDKNKEFDTADYGISSFETAFALSYTGLVETGILTMVELMERMSKNPASILGLTSKGRVAEGLDGDLIIVDIDETYEIDGTKFASKAKFTPFAGTKVKGKVVHTIVDGRVVL